MARWNGKFFDKDNVMPSALINVSSGVPGTPIEQSDLDALKGELRADYTAAARKTAITSADSMQAILLGWNAKDMDFIGGRQFTKDELYAIYGVPAGLTDKNATEANATTADKIFKEKTVWPLLVLIAEQMTAELVVPYYGPDLEATFDDIRPANRALELQEDISSRETLTIDERRKRFWKLGPLPNGRGTKTAAESQAISAPANMEALPAGQQIIDQPQAATDIVSQVATGALPRDSALQSPVHADLRRWRDKALKAFKTGDGAAVKFESEWIQPDQAEEIREQLEQCKSIDSIKTIFASALEVAGAGSFFRSEPIHRYQGYPVTATLEPV
jgi:hypothetical protein